MLSVFITYNTKHFHDMKDKERHFKQLQLWY
jgi:hypothetical protein